MKIVEAMYGLMPEGPQMVPYEDIVIKAWEMYPKDFGLRGHADKHPDSSDIHKRLYGTLKEQGWVKSGAAGKKQFTLTQSGWERADKMFGHREKGSARGGRLGRAAEQEIAHLIRTDAARLFQAGEKDEILDTDFFAFYRTSVRASPQDFEGRLSEVRLALEEAHQLDRREATSLLEVDDFLRNRFSDLIDVKSERKKRVMQK